VFGSEDVLGTGISLVEYGDVLGLIRNPPPDRALIVAVCNVHSVMTARRDSRVREALASADVRTPDGVPLVWLLRSYGHREQERVYGPEIMRRGIVELDECQHFLYGSTERTLRLLEKAIFELNPNSKIAGTISPPFGDLSDEEVHSHAKRIRESGATVVWVGMGMPKQELLMPRLAPHLPATALVGVGAAFDILAGTVKQAPAWAQRAGLEWLVRLVQEPRRLIRRYIVNNPTFLVLWWVTLLRRRMKS
jgi:N-acetylglucosaminyldiphosphoundecaprenol N-acetyl-beta-D-mannosaminyltransferase